MGRLPTSVDNHFLMKASLAKAIGVYICDVWEGHMDRGNSLPGASVKLYKLEALRGLAAIYVVFHHALPHKYYVSGFNLYNVFRFGQEAVILFFMLSGFVISYSFAKSSDKSFRQYFLRRFLRIYIPLVCVFLLSYLIVSLTVGKLVNPELPSLLGNIFMLQDWAKVKPHTFFDPYLQNNPLWSLSYEWWFYMLFFPIATFIKSSKLQDCVVFTMCLLASLVYVFYPLFPVRVAMYFAIWWTGVVLANQYMRNGNISFKAVKLPLLSLLAIVAVLFVHMIISRYSGQPLFFGIHPVLELRHFSFALLTLIIAIKWHSVGWPLFNSIIKPFAVLAPISYTVYILHVPVMTQSNFLSWIESPLVQWLGYFVTLIVLSYLIELVFYPKARGWIRASFGKPLQKTMPVLQKTTIKTDVSAPCSSIATPEKRHNPGAKADRNTNTVTKSELVE